MKEFNKTNKVTYNLMSFTGFKSLLLFSILLESPKTYGEMQECIKNHEYLHEQVSIDTLRVYLNSLARVGCIVKRFKDPEVGYKFYIKSHPYEFIISREQIRSLIKVYKIILKTLKVTDVYAYEKFLRKIADTINSHELLESIEKVSIFNDIDIDLIEKLIEHTKKKHKITILYDSANSTLKEVELFADDLVVTQGKLYLCGFSLKYQQDTTYLVSRIKEFVKADLKGSRNIEVHPVTVGYELSTTDSDVKLSEDEKIVEIKSDSIIIETETTNLFMMKRRILEYGPLCTVLYPESFRNDIVSTLKNMREIYNDGKE